MQQIKEEIEQLDVKQLYTLKLLMAGKTLNEISKELQVDRTTIWRWCKKPAFKKLYNESINYLKIKIESEIDNVVDRAVHTLINLLNDNIKDEVRRKTASYIIDRVLIAKHEGLDIEESLKEICLNKVKEFEDIQERES